ncbi:MAG TPA: peptide-binding protein, partial [Bacteroidetes bacterium]|nr:peptide-binding protein [Bacteroidota bacterium]
QKPVSSGPFILKRRVKNQFIELVRNKNYFGKKPNLERVIFKIVPDKTSLLLQLKNGEIDMMAGVNPDHVADLQSSNPDIALYRVSGRTYYYIGYNEKNPLFKEKQVRRALTMAIDRNGLIEATLQGYGKPCTGPVPPIVSWAYNDSIPPIPFNVAGAKNLLANAGWKDHDGDGWLDKDGRDFKFVLRTNAGNQIKADLAVIVQDQLKKIGVKVDIRSLEWTAFMDKLRRKEFDAYIGGWSTSFNVDPTPIFHSTATNLFNYIGYNNPQVDQLIEAGREEMNRQKAAKIWKTMQDEIYRDQPYTFLFWLDKIVAVNSKFKNVTPIPLSMFYGLENWYEAKISTD